MTIEDKMLAAGGQVVISTLFINHVEMGHYTSAGFVLTPEGEAWALTEDLDPPKPKAASKTTKHKPDAE